MSEKKSINAENLIGLGEYFTIKKHEPGNLRLAVSLKIKNEQFDIPEEVKQAKLSWDMLWQALPGIIAVKPRLLIMAVDIQYDAEQILPDYWESWVAKDPSVGLVSYVENAITSLLSQMDATRES